MNTARLCDAEARLSRRFPSVPLEVVDAILVDSLHRIGQAFVDPRVADDNAIALACLRLEIATERATAG